VCAFARLDGDVVGIVGNQPSVLAGALDIDASEKAARFVRTCDAFNIPLVTLVDVPGFLPGTAQEHNGIIRRGAKLLYAYCEATVPRIQVILRKAFGGAYIVMDSKSIGADLSLAWPSNQIAVMGAAGAADVVFRREIAASDDPARRRDELIEQYEDVLLNPYVAAQRGLVDDVIDPAETRQVLVRALSMLRTKRDERPPRKHGNMPL
jgi:acetyl-CoA carboxylase carboxyltransferase component